MGKKREVGINEFPLHTLFTPKPSGSYGVKVAIIGKPGSGKSFLTRDIVRTFTHAIPTALIFSASEDENHFYGEMFDDLYIRSDYNEEDMKIFEERQKKVMQDNCANPNALVVIDDCSADTKFFRRPQFQRHYKYSRHWETLTLLGLQYCNDIPPAIKTSIDYSFIFREPNELNRKKIYDNYAGVVGSYHDFCDLMDQLTGDYTSLVINNRVQSNEPEDCVFYYKARAHPDFKFGCQEYQQWAEARYNPSYMRG